MQSASTRDSQACTLRGGNTMRHSPFYRRSSHKPAVSEGLVTLAEHKRPEAIWLIGLRPYTFQYHTCKAYDIDVS